MNKQSKIYLQVPINLSISIIPSSIQLKKYGTIHLKGILIMLKEKQSYYLKRTCNLFRTLEFHHSKQTLVLVQKEQIFNSPFSFTCPNPLLF